MLIPGSACNKYPLFGVTWYRTMLSLNPLNCSVVRPLLATVEIPQNATKPGFPGGMDEMQRFLQENIKQPRGSQKSGSVTIGFAVNKKGEVVGTEVIRSMGRAFDAEALRVIGLMPGWEPARIGERPVRSKVQVPVRFDGKQVPREKRGKDRSTVK